MLTAQLIYNALQERNRLADEAIDRLYGSITRAAEAEEKYRTEKAKAVIESTAMPDPYTGKRKTTQLVEAEVDLQVGLYRLSRDIAEGMKTAAHQEVKLRTSQLSAAQTVAGAFREEAKFGRTGPGQ